MAMNNAVMAWSRHRTHRPYPAWLLGLALTGLGTMPDARAQVGPDPLTVRIEVVDANHFARIFRDNGGHPSAAQLQKGYLDAGSVGLKEFVSDGIGDATRLANAVAADPGKYRRAIDGCLPHVTDHEDSVRAIYLAYRGLFPEVRLPRIFALFGSGNASGLVTTGGSAVLGLEQVCQDRDNMIAAIRNLAAHETAHALQRALPNDSLERRDLLAWALREGAANYLAALVTGNDRSGADNAWASSREPQLFDEFMRDRQTMREHWRGAEPDTTAVAAGTRWMWNQRADDGRPADLAYWIGQRIWHAYYQKHPDKRAATRAMLVLPDPDKVLRDSGYQSK